MKKLLAEERRISDKEELARELQREAEAVQKQEEPKPATADDKQPQPEAENKAGAQPPGVNGQPEGPGGQAAEGLVSGDPQAEGSGAADGTTLPPPPAPLPPRDQFMFPNQPPPAMAKPVEAEENLANDGQALGVYSLLLYRLFLLLISFFSHCIYSRIGSCELFIIYQVALVIHLSICPPAHPSIITLASPSSIEPFHGPTPRTVVSTLTD